MRARFQDFLVWGTKNYGAKENVLVLWDHGGKSGDKTCIDEAFNNDALDRVELTAAFKGAELPFKFDIVVFDACFMSTLENAVIMGDYAHYFVPSQEVVPSSGIDYQAFAQNIGKLGVEDLGYSICNDYYTKSEAREPPLDSRTWTSPRPATWLRPLATHATRWCRC